MEALRVVTHRTVLGLAWPIMVSLLSFTAMSLVDTLYLGRLGTEPLAAVGIAVPILFTVLAFPYGVLAGTKVLVSQWVGADQPGLAAQSAWVGVLLAVAFGVVGVVGPIIGEAGALWMGATPGVAALAAPYVFVRLSAAPMVFLIAASHGAFQGSGDTRTPMKATLIANAVNILLDPIFIFGFGSFEGWGVMGAAVATVIGQVLSLFYLVPRFLRRFGRGRLPEVSLLVKLWRLGAPLGVERLLAVGGFVAFASLIARIGSAELAAHVLVIRIISISFLPGEAIGQAASVIAGQAVGAGDPRRVRQGFIIALQLSLVIMGAWSVAFLLVPHLLLVPFGVTGEVAELAVGLLFVSAFFQLADALVMSANGALSGVGDTRMVLVLTTLESWFVRLPVGYVLAVPFGMGVDGVYWGLMAGLSSCGVLGTWRVLSDGWQGARRVHVGMVAAK